MSSARILMGGRWVDLANISHIEAGYSMARGLATCGLSLAVTIASCAIGPVASAFAAIVSFMVIASELITARRQAEQVRIRYQAGREERIACLSARHAVETRDRLLHLKTIRSR